MTVTNVNETPEITAGDAAHSFPEIEWDASSPDLTVGSYEARDEESETIGWTLAGTDSGDLRIDSSTGVLSFAARPNFEMPADAPETGETEGDNVYKIIVRARDTANNTREFPVTVTVTDVDETPEVDGPADNPNYPEAPYDSDAVPNVVAVFTARDEEGQEITWSLTGDDAGVFSITKDGATGNGTVTFDDPPDFEMPGDDDSLNTYQFTVQANDGTNTGTWDYMVTVTDVNERPELTGTVTDTVTLEEHDANEAYVPAAIAEFTARDEEGGVTWFLTGTDRGDFAVDGSGDVTFVNAPNFETPADSGGDSVYEFTVVATDIQSGSNRLTATVDVTVTVTDVEEAGSISLDNPDPGVGDILRFVLSDPDGGIDTDAPVDGVSYGGLRWDIQSAPSATGPWEFVAARFSTGLHIDYTVDEDETGEHLRAIVASYTDRRGSGKSAESAATNPVTADPIVNAPPRFRTGFIRSIPEGPAGRDVGGPIGASDRDNDTLTYGIQSGGDSALFEINPPPGSCGTPRSWTTRASRGACPSWSPFATARTRTAWSKPARFRTSPNPLSSGLRTRRNRASSPCPPRSRRWRRR